MTWKQDARGAKQSPIALGRNTLAKKHDEKKVKFSTIWANYPDENPYVDSKTGEPPENYENQCAIKLSVALQKAGVDMKSFRGGSRILINGKGTAGLADELADWLKLRPFYGCPRAEEYAGKTVFDKIMGRTGIIYLANYWERKPGVRTGDHIDLWNGIRMTSYTSLLRVKLGISWDGVWSDYKRAEEAFFWNIL